VQDGGRGREQEEVEIRKEIWIVLCVLALDQVSKLVVSASMSPGDSVEVLNSFLRLTYVHNPYAAFGIAVGPPKLHFLFSSLALGVVVWVLLRSSSGLQRHALALVLGGALGNILDRLRTGEVVDFLDVGIRTYRWPVFNLADLAVTGGIVLLVWGYVGGKDRGRGR